MGQADASSELFYAPAQAPGFALPNLPVLQSLILAEHIYELAHTRNKVIVSTFNMLKASEFPAVFKATTFAYLCLTDLKGPTPIQLHYVDLSTNDILMKSPELTVKADSPLDSVEIIIEIPPFPMPHPGAFAFEAHCNNAILGSLRIRVEEGSIQ